MTYQERWNELRTTFKQLERDARTEDDWGKLQIVLEAMAHTAKLISLERKEQNETLRMAD